MNDAAARFEQVDQFAQRDNDPWPSVIIRREAIESEIERLESIARPSVMRRDSRIVHPSSKQPGLGLAPSIDVVLNVLKPGEQTPPTRHNAGQLSMCIRGAGVATVNGKEMPVGKFDVWTAPSMNVFSLKNTGDDVMACLTYSNAPLLRKLEVYYSEDDCSMPESAHLGPKPVGKRAKDGSPIIQITDDGAYIAGYEHLIDPDFEFNRPLLWPFESVDEHLKDVRDLAQGYTGRRLYLLYNPATKERNGTTHTFFATIAAYPPNLNDVSHRHSSAAINYYMSGNGHSLVDGQDFYWEGGDLMLSAPGWVEHVHRSRDQGFYSLTVQDHPLMIAMESLIWQETMDGPVLNLGAEMGFQTNLAQVSNS